MFQWLLRATEMQAPQATFTAGQVCLSVGTAAFKLTRAAAAPERVGPKSDFGQHDPCRTHWSSGDLVFPLQLEFRNSSLAFSG